MEDAGRERATFRKIGVFPLGGAVRWGLLLGWGLARPRADNASAIARPGF
jgi:hypothetical protein